MLKIFHLKWIFQDMFVAELSCERTVYQSLCIFALGNSVYLPYVFVFFYLCLSTKTTQKHRSYLLLPGPCLSIFGWYQPKKPCTIITAGHEIYLPHIHIYFFITISVILEICFTPSLPFPETLGPHRGGIITLRI